MSAWTILLRLDCLLPNIRLQISSALVADFQRTGCNCSEANCATMPEIEFISRVPLLMHLVFKMPDLQNKWSHVKKLLLHARNKVEMISVREWIHVSVCFYSNRRSLWKISLMNSEEGFHFFTFVHLENWLLSAQEKSLSRSQGFNSMSLFCFVAMAQQNITKQRNSKLSEMMVGWMVTFFASKVWSQNWAQW